ncbi:MAG: DMT family transporter [Magnetospirillum sp. WYHS-4]
MPVLDRLPPLARGALMVVAACFLFTLVAVMIRIVTREVDPVEVAFFRNFFGLVFVLPWVLRLKGGLFRTGRLGLHALRAAIGVCATIAWFMALAVMPLAEATALSFTSPLFATLGAGLLLGEKVDARRWLAVGIGFAGAMVVLQPGLGALRLDSLLALAAAACMAGSALSVKTLSRSETPATVVFYMGLIGSPLALLPALPVWTAPSPTAWPYLAGIGLCAMLGQMLMVRGMAAADASAIMPFDFSRLIFAALAGAVLFGEMPDLWTWTGSGLIFLAALQALGRRPKVEEQAEALAS